jgi:biopolymer transport protein ExbD
MVLNLAPMVDVMMCLIIFFLLGSQMVDAERRPVELPFAEQAKPPTAAEASRRVVVTVRRPVQPDAPAEYVVNGWDGQNIVERVLGPADVDGYLQRAVELANARPDEMRCVIRADRETSYRDVEVVLRGCGKSKIAHVVFGAIPGIAPEAGG